MVVEEVVKQSLDLVKVALEGEEDEEHLEIFPVGHQVVVVELLAGVVSLPLLDDLEQGVINWPSYSRKESALQDAKSTSQCFRPASQNDMPASQDRRPDSHGVDCGASLTE